MTRRDFLVTSAVVGLSTSIQAQGVSIESKELKAVEPIIAAVQQHMFPRESKLPSAKAMNTITFLLETITHSSYDRDIRRFVIEGAQELERRTEGKFLTMDSAEKERVLRSYEETSYGSNWLARIMTLTMEAIFSDPIYGSNIVQEGWKAVESFGGLPRPKQRYIYG
ncbi:gluconate 2-dehydrogenase subunit 3 family protein [Sulfurovum sp. zt1-1]|uniref:Gluconate 2-dehydrogenase subunit 3 family protein n=1 Tax=Sulfurovum zhangzhouensis TaxID=3019067 RepID=A0ABT7R1W6_9BACT|nr:gluconate 2-dehydrogenase subunit 3 family protein [Sulfurovum zhangzhouensis]MDM5272526.1 gluconate 2-dehydrogenase subunit 3 family protein [Sulfurovum zhangzhouensis]